MAEEKVEKKGSILDWLFVETPFVLSVVLSIASALGVFYLLSPKEPKVIYTFDAAKFKDDLLRRATVARAAPQTVSMVTADLRRMLDELARREKTVVINRRAVISNGLPTVEMIDVTEEVEKRLFSRYFPGIKGTKDELFRELKKEEKEAKNGASLKTE